MGWKASLQASCRVGTPSKAFMGFEGGTEALQAVSMFEPQMPLVAYLCLNTWSQAAGLFWEAMNALGGKAQGKEAGHLGRVLGGMLSLAAFCHSWVPSHCQHVLPQPRPRNTAPNHYGLTALNCKLKFQLSHSCQVFCYIQEKSDL